MSRSHPVLRILGQLLTPAGPNHFVYLSAHPEQDQAVLDALAMDVGTAPGYRLVADVDCFLLLADHDYQGCLDRIANGPYSRSAMDWVAEHASGDEVEWHGCVTEVALQGAAGSLSRVTLGYYPMKEAEAIAALLAPTPELVRLNPKCILVADAAGDIYHYQLRYPGDSDDTVLFVRAIDCDTGLEFAKAHLRSIHQVGKEVEVTGINAGLLARAA
ncbi:hypothetical protein QO021_28960 (plasmid) [Pseudomonas amygdali pv. lachrymans]|uniref:hypothetical protein n=1 Tax=Pseudomonas amygdali TaxID=47877 RepID=UPI0006B9C139|nr:hypothetical protein [Pseudomonas amygdali]RMM39423.1 hypothetical protein ALQ79_200444 [Pseudomonas amygdali pv. lachrymans]WIO61590.1 hypothetical protein QO021_28960 [Pseudomonas amygdali pv. lachrymans]